MKNKIQLCSRPVWLAAILVASVITPGLSFGQGGIPTPTPTLTPTQTQIPQQQSQTGQTGQQQQSGGGRQTAETTDGGVVDIDPSQAVKFSEFENTRNQGFVGATSTRIDERGFVGASSQLMGANAAGTDVNFGGGLNTTAGTGASGGGRGQASFGNQGIGSGNFGSNQFGQGASNQNSFDVQRGGLRGYFQPSFTFPVALDEQVSDQFSTNFSQLPQSQLFNGQYQVVVNNKKATVSGWVNSKAESELLVAQLRFQPGIYEIENNLEIREE